MIKFISQQLIIVNWVKLIFRSVLLLIIIAAIIIIFKIVIFFLMFPILKF